MLVKIDRDLEDIVPIFMENRREDIKTMREFLQEEDYLKLSRLGHAIKGTGGGYGFDHITEIGLKIEQSSNAKERKGVESAIDELEKYINEVEIEYV